MIAALTSLGGVCTHDWTKVMRAMGPEASLADEALLPELRRDIHEGVMRAEAFVFLVPQSSTIGAYVELGAAMVAARLGVVEVHVVGPSPHAWARAAMTLRHATDEAFVSWFVGEMSVMRARAGCA